MMKYLTYKDLIEMRGWDEELIPMYLTPIDSQKRFDYIQVIKAENKLSANGIVFKVKK